MINIQYIDHMGDDLSTVNSARVSYGKQKSELDNGDIRLINYLAKHRHMTPFRHNQIQLRCKAPIFVARQLGKHQAGLTWNEVSRRYVDDAPEFFLPATWRSKPESSKQGSGEDMSHKDQEYWDLMYDGLLGYCEQIYESAVADGMAPEQARMMLPQSMMTEWIWTGNLLAFSHVYKERIHQSAQAEVQYFALQLGDICEQLFPYSWKALIFGGE